MSILVQLFRLHTQSSSLCLPQAEHHDHFNAHSPPPTLAPPPRPCHLLTDHGVQPLQNGLAKGDGPRRIRKVLNLMALFRTAFSQQPLSKAGPTRDCFKDFPFCPFVRHICPLGKVSISQFQLFPYAFLSFWASRDASCFICGYLFAPPGKPSWMGDQRSPTQLFLMCSCINSMGNNYVSVSPGNPGVPAPQCRCSSMGASPL